MMPHHRQPHARRDRMPEGSTIDTRVLIAVVVISVFALIATWRLLSLPPGVMWWQ